MQEFELPEAISALVTARNALRDHYRDRLHELGGRVTLSFTLDGNLIGDIGEALAVELFGVRLVEGRGTKGIDGLAPDGRTVQVKASGTGRGPAFRFTETRADHLLFFDLNLSSGIGTVAFNGPECLVFKKQQAHSQHQRMISARKVREADLLVRPEERLRPLHPLGV